jgi:phage-related protein
VEVQEAANVLLTFKNVSEETFGTALGLSADLSAVLGTDLQSSTLQLGKALNDPIRGITALSRAGVQFTAEQQEMIKSLVESGDALGAQQLILGELESQVGGVAAASADSTAKIGNAFTELQRALGGPLIAAIDQIAPALIGVADALEPVFASVGEVVGGLLVQIAPILETLGTALGEGLRALLPAVEPVGAAVLAIVEAFAPLLPVIGQLAATLIPPLADVLTLLAGALAPVIGLVTELAGEVLSRLEPVFPPIVDIIGRVAGLLGGVLAEVIGTQVDLWFTLFDAVAPIIPVLLGLVEALLPILDPILTLVQQLLRPLADLLGALLVPLVALIEPIVKLVTLFAEALGPAQEDLIRLLTDALVPILEVLAEVLLITLVPILEGLAALLEGDVSGAFEAAGGQFLFLRDVAVTVWRAISSFVAGRIDALISTVNRVRGIVSRIRGFFDQARAAVLDRIGAIVGLVRGLPGRILRSLGNLGRLLYNAGRNVIRGLLDGIRSMIQNLRDTISSVAETVRNFLPFSPAKEGPLSGAGSPDRAGAAIATMVARGLVDELPAIRAAAAALAAAGRPDTIATSLGGRIDPGLDAAIARSVRGGDGATATQPGGVRVRPTPAAAEPTEFVIRGDGSQMAELIVQILAKAIRQKGGNVQAVLGTGPGGARR